VKVQRRLPEFAAADVDVMGVGFSEQERLDFIRDELDITFPLVSDTERRWYRALDIGAGGWLSVFAPRILWRYVRLIARGYRLRRPTDDLRQLGGDVLLRDTQVVALWSGAESERRPSVDEVLEAARSRTAAD
jgi:hypothetical protein